MSYSLTMAHKATKDDRALETSETTKPTGIRRIWLALCYSMDGFKAAWTGEAAFRQEVVLAAILLSLVFFVGSGEFDDCYFRLGSDYHSTDLLMKLESPMGVFPG